MPLNPTIILGGRAPDIESPAEAQLKQFRLRQAQQQLQLGDLQIAKAQETAPQTQSDEDLLKEVMQETGGDPAKIGYALLTRGKFKQAMEFIKGWDEHVKATQPPKPSETGFTLSPGQTRYDAQGKPLATSEVPVKPEKAPNVGSFEDYVTRTYGDTPTPAQVLKARKEYMQADDKAPVIHVSAAASQDASDVKESVSGMRDHSIPPILPSRASREYTALMAEAHRQGVNLVKLNEDWTATQKYLSTLNGAQQVRLRQAVKFAKDSLPLVESLAKQWDAGRFADLNKVNLTLAKKGAYGQQAASLATKLDAQIADITSELGTVYKGGNSSTDESLALAAKNLNANWSKQTLLDNLAQIRQNLEIRQGSILLGTPVANEGNQYAQQPQAAPAGTVEKWVRDPKTGKLVKQ